MLNKVVTFVFFAHKKYSQKKKKKKVEPLMSHGLFYLAVFLDLGTFQLCCCSCRVREISDFIRNILICVPKMSEGLTGLTQLRGQLWPGG